MLRWLCDDMAFTPLADNLQGVPPHPFLLAPAANL